MEVPEELRLALELAEMTAASRGRFAPFAREMVSLLKRAEEQIRALDVPVSLVRSTKRGNERIYLAEKDASGHGEVLAEHRTSGKSYPFRCSKALYDAMTEVLITTDRPLFVEEIASAVEKKMGERPADFQVRVPLRLWLSVDPPLVIRNRARYRAARPVSLASDANILWTKLRTA